MWQYRHDAAGNLLLFDHWDAGLGVTVTAQYVINGANQVQCIDEDGSGTCNGTERLWEYNAYGNLLNDYVTRYTYDAAGRLSSATIDGGTTTYTYNGDGERVSQTHLARTTTYVLDVVASTVLSATTDKGLANEETITYLNGLTAIAQSEVKPDGTTVSYLQYDGTGSVRQMTNPSGVVQYSQTYDPYGNLYSKTDGNGSAIGFGGGTQDSNGLVYSGGQYYSPSRGLFVRQQLNRLGQSLSQSQTGREISQAAYNMQPMAEGALESTGSLVSPATWPSVYRHTRSSGDAAYNAGERRFLALAAHYTGATDILIGGANAINQLNADVPVVFGTGYRWYDRLPAATRIGGTAVAVGDLAAMVYFPIKGAIIRAGIARNNAWVAQRFAYLDELIDVGSLRGGSISEIVAQDRAFRRYYARAGWVDNEAAAWQYADEAAMGIGGGPGLTDADYAEMAIEYVTKANDLRKEAGLQYYMKTKKVFRRDNTTFGFGSSHMDESGALIDYLAGTNNFPNVTETKQWEWLQARAKGQLQSKVREYYPNVVWVGSELVSGENLVIGGKLAPELHLEYLMAHSKGLSPNSRIAYGIANTICDACTSMITGLGGQQISGGVWRVPLENGTVIFFAGK